MADVSGEKIGEIFVEINARTKKLEDEIKQLKGKVDKEAENMGASFSSKFTKMLATAGAATAIYQFFKRAVVGAMEAERAEVALRTQLGYTSQALLDQALALQKVTMFEDDTVTKAQSMIAAFTKNETQIIALTKASTDLAAAKGLDLVSAAELVAKTFGSETNALARSGIQVDATAGSTKRLEQITKGLAELYGGQAEAAGKTFAGTVAQIKNNIDNITEAIGGKLIGVLSVLSDKLKSVSQESSDLKMPLQSIEVIVRTLAIVFAGFTQAVVTIGIVLGGFIGMLAKVGKELPSLAEGMAQIAAGHVMLGSSMVGNSIDNIAESYKKWDKILGSTKDNFAEFYNMMLHPQYGSKLPDVPKPPGKREVGGLSETDKAKLIQEANDFAQEQLKQQDEVDKQRLQNITQYYDDVKFKDENYFAWKSDQIMREVSTEEIKNEKLKKLVDELYEYERDKVTDKSLLGKSAEDIKNENETTPHLRNPRDGADYKKTKEEIEKADDANKQFASTIASSFSQGIMAGENLGDVFKNLVIQLSGMVVQALAFKAIMAVLNVGSGGFLSTIFGAHDGGSFIGTSSGVMKMASGGSFIVPTGYANDSFPLMVETGERVTVTPASQVRSSGDNSAVLSALAQLNVSIKSMNRNLINKQFDAHIYNPIDGTILVKQLVSPTENSLIKAGVSLEKL